MSRTNMIENEDDLKPLGVGILGAANIAKKTIRALSMTPHFHVVAIGSRSKQKAQELLDASPNATSASTSLCSYDEVLASQDVDIVYIPLPSALHLEWVEKAANAGKHILLEKPIATSAEEASAMVEACARNNVQLMDGTMWMHHKRADLMMEMLQSGKLGDVKDVTAIFSFTAPADFHTNVRFQAECDPLGALGDLGWYCIRAILWVYNELPVSVTAHQGTVFNDAGVPMHIGATLLFSGDRRGLFRCGFDTALTQTLEVAGTVGTIRVDDFVIPFNELKADFIRTREHGLVELDTRDATIRDVFTVHLDKPQEVSMWETMACCVRRIQAGQAPNGHWPRIAESTQRVVSAVETSARQGHTPVYLGDQP